jgi:hypothetical protein
MPDDQGLKEQARAKARSLLTESESFRNMDREEQMMLYKDLVDANYNDLAKEQGLATEFAAGDLIDKERHKNTRIGGVDQDAADIMGKLVNKVNFPGFVRDLLVGVFDANQDANERQMRVFMDLMRQATKSLAEYVREIDNDETMMRLVQSNNQYRLGMTKAGAGRRRGGKEPNPVLVDQSGKEVNMNDAAIQAKILDARLALAKERRTLLRETMLMGVSRLVIEKGVIRANVKFRVDASEDTVNDDQGEDRRHEESSFRAGFFGMGARISRQRSQVSIATSNTEMNSTLSAEMEGFVEIQFKSDYFKLDNFKEIFDLGAGQVPSTAPQQLPAAPAAPAATPTP